jgi:hypothetical protein
MGSRTFSIDYKSETPLRLKYFKSPTKRIGINKELTSGSKIRKEEGMKSRFIAAIMIVTMGCTKPKSEKTPPEDTHPTPQLQQYRPETQEALNLAAPVVKPIAKALAPQLVKALFGELYFSYGLDVAAQNAAQAITGEEITMGQNIKNSLKDPTNIPFIGDAILTVMFLIESGGLLKDLIHLSQSSADLQAHLDRNAERNRNLTQEEVSNRMREMCAALASNMVVDIFTRRNQPDMGEEHAAFLRLTVHVWSQTLRSHGCDFQTTRDDIASGRYLTPETVEQLRIMSPSQRDLLLAELFFPVGFENAVNTTAGARSNQSQGGTAPGGTSSGAGRATTGGSPDTQNTDTPMTGPTGTEGNTTMPAAGQLR